MGTCKLKLDEEKSKHVGLVEHFCTVCRGWYEAQQSLTPAVDLLLIG
jgi:hypothetical protein